MEHPPLIPRRLRPDRVALAAALLLFSSLEVHSATPTLIWSDEFNQPDGTGPDPTKWNYDLGAGFWGNDELEYYTDSRANSYVISDPDAVDGKALVIAALKDPVYGTYTSARLQTGALFEASYGHIEARVKTTSTQGLWPAFWMLGGDFLTGTNWPDCGEIDILETIDTSEVLFGTAHGPGYGIGGQVDLPIGQNFSQAYHVVALDWEPNQLQWSMDGVVYFTLTPADLPAGAPWEFNNSPFFILINLAVGGDWPGSPDATTVFPALYTIDYVRVYGFPPTAPAAGQAVASSAREVDLSWPPPADLKGFTLTGYQVTRATNSALTQGAVTFTAGPTATFADTFVAGGTTYYYSVAAVSTGGVSDPSPVFSATTPLPAPGSIPAQLTSLSARAFVGTGNGILIGGFFISGTTSCTVLVQALGPALESENVPGVLLHPALSIHQTRNGKDVVLYTNAGWDAQGPDSAAVLANAASAVYAQPALAAGSGDSEALLTLPPGGYTVEVTGADGGTGVALCAIYELP